MRALTRADVVVADQLFATLDPTTRRLRLPNGRDATISDTVGFVSKLPHDLVEAFRSTLEEVTRSDLVLHVADAATPDLEAQVEAVRGVLDQIGAGSIPEVLALNKMDLLDADERERVSARFPGALAISAVTGEGLAALLEEVAVAIPRFPVTVTVLVPHDRGDLVALLHRDAEVLSEDPREDGVEVRARVGERVYAQVRRFGLERSGGEPA
jgi:GTP-binding protein HflX